jgi:cytochrome P450
MNLDNFFAGTPREEIARLRAQHRAVWQEDERVGGYWLVLRQPEIDRVLKTPADFTSRVGMLLEDMPPDFLAEQQDTMTFTDPPEHGRWRTLVKHAFLPSALRARLPLMQDSAREIIDSVIAAGRCEFVREVAMQLPMRVMYGLLGVRAEDYERVVDLTNTMSLASDPDFAESRALGYEATRKLVECGTALAADHRREPRDTMTLELLRAELDGHRLTDSEFGQMFVTLIVGGLETTRNTLAWLVYEFIRNPEQYARLQADLSLVPAAVEEILRLQNTVVYVRRTATRDLELGGESIAKGDKLVCMLGAPNRDAEHFPDPDRFDITRDPAVARRVYRTFGGGPHFCLGVHQARFNLEVMTEEIARRLSNLRLLATPRRFRSNFMDGFKELQIAFEARSA